MLLCVSSFESQFITRAISSARIQTHNVEPLLRFLIDRRMDAIGPGRVVHPKKS